MKPLWILLGLIAALLAVVLAFTLKGAAPRAGESAQTLQASAAAEIENLQRQVALLSHRIDELEHARPLDSFSERADATLPSAPRNAGDPERRDPRWYLDQYVLSFADSPTGSEYFRLAVEAYVTELRAPICELVRDGGRIDALRSALAGMLGKTRFRGDMEVVNALLECLHAPAGEALSQKALASLEIAGEARAELALENLLFTLTQNLGQRALQVIKKLAGEQANTALFRLFLHAPSDEWRIQLVQLLDGSELAAALDLLRASSTQEQPVRLAGAIKIGDFIEDEFQAFVVEWLRVETDEQVIEALHGAQKQQKDIPGWHAMKACGPPDANPKRDDPNAWASASGDMGIQWLELTYATPMRASGVRIYEVNSPGAVCEIKARNASGEWETLWSGTASGNGAPLVLEWPLTAYEVKTIRVVLDTNRTPGWNEIDAVELIGSGAQWAKHASASSSYGGGRGGLNTVFADRVGIDALFNQARIQQR